MKYIKRLLIVGVVAALLGCGGGGGDSGTSLYGTGNTTTSGSGSDASGTGSTNGTVSTNSSGTVVLTLSNNTVSASSPGTVTALVKKSDGSPLANTIVTFAVTNGTAGVSPERVITDAQGNASTTLLPSSGKIGADYVTASADIPGGSALTTQVAFTVSSVSVTLANMTSSPATVDAYGASVISADVSGASSAVPVTVNFSSTCATSGKAVLSPTSVTVTGATASTTYQDKGCSTTDRIIAVITGTSQQKQTDLIIKAPTAQSLEFVSASPDKICLAGSGCSASAIVSFRLKDQFGNPVAGRELTFSLDIQNVADLSFVTAKTNASGIAEVSVSSKVIPSPVRVHAETLLDSGAKLATVSNVLAINAGLPTQRSVSFSAEKYNVDGWRRDGIESQIRLQLSDRFGNPVPDGTSISLVSEGASVIPARCVTANGVCTSKFVSSNYRPANGRVTVLAFAQGEESFTDTDKNNIYSTGEVFADLGEVFIDKNENGVLDTAIGEYIAGEAANGKWDGNTYVRAGAVFTLSDSSRVPRLFAATASGDGRVCSNTPFSPVTLSPKPDGACKMQALFCLRDGNVNADLPDAEGSPGGGNPIPAGALLSATTTAKGVTVSVDNTPVSSTNVPTAHLITAALSDCATALTSSGDIDVVIKMPAGETYTITVGRVQ